MHLACLMYIYCAASFQCAVPMETSLLLVNGRYFFVLFNQHTPFLSFISFLFFFISLLPMHLVLVVFFYFFFFLCMHFCFLSFVVLLACSSPFSTLCTRFFYFCSPCIRFQLLLLLVVAFCGCLLLLLLFCVLVEKVILFTPIFVLVSPSLVLLSVLYIPHPFSLFLITLFSMCIISIFFCRFCSFFRYSPTSQKRIKIAFCCSILLFLCRTM